MTDQVFKAKLRAIQADRSSGAAELARSCLEILIETALQDNSDSTQEFLDKLISRIDSLSLSRPSMAPIANLLNIFRENIAKFKNHPPLEARKRCADAARQIIKASIIATEKTVKNAAALIGNNKTIFTHSYSSTVLQTFTQLSRQNLKVIITEARPLCEGFRLAEKLSELQIPTTLITDAQAGLFVRKADMILVGADSILSDFSTVNKTGTYLIALSAYDNSIPFYVCCEKYKQILPNGKQPELEIMSPEELKAPVLPHVNVENIYFEITPAKFITGWINEDGVLRIQPH